MDKNELQDGDARQIQMILMEMEFLTFWIEMMMVMVMQLKGRLKMLMVKFIRLIKFQIVQGIRIILVG